jgi:hypothetical protein
MLDAQFVSKLWVICAGIITFTVTTIGCVLIFFKPLSENDTLGQPWPAAVAIAIYVFASVFLHDWLSRAASSSYKAAFALACAQAILIVDLLARGERGVITAVAGIAMLIITWGALAAMHAWMTRSQFAEL